MALLWGFSLSMLQLKKQRLREAKRLSVRGRVGWKRQIEEGQLCLTSDPGILEGQKAPGGGVGWGR